MFKTAFEGKTYISRVQCTLFPVTILFFLKLISRYRKTVRADLEIGIFKKKMSKSVSGSQATVFRTFRRRTRVNGEQAARFP